MTDSVVFDRASVVRNRLRAHSENFLVDEIAARLADRLLDIQRTFPEMLDFSGQPGLSKQLSTSGVAASRGIETVFTLVGTAAFATRENTMVASAEALPVAAQRVDLAMSVMALHWANDLPGTLVQVRRVLKRDGLLLAAFLGGDTLMELRECLGAAEIDVSGGISPRVIPFVDLRDAGGLLQRAGFALPVADQDRINVTYASPVALMHDLRAMGETNALTQRRKQFTSRKVFARASALYEQRYAKSGRINATFDVIYLTGWAPHESQQKPLRPGSATTRLAEALEAEEQPTGDKADPTPLKKIP